MSDRTTIVTPDTNLILPSGAHYQFHTKPFGHQYDEFVARRDVTGRAIFWEQGTGKSKLMIDTAAWLYLCGLIDCVIVVAPNGVHRNWVENEIPDHTPRAVLNASRAMQYQAPKADTKYHKQAVKSVLTHQGLSWFAISYDAFTTNNGKRALIQFFDKRRVLYILDEGHYVKSPDALRTRSILMSAKYAKYRRLLTGTPIAQGPFDAYSEIQFLDDQFWMQQGFSTFTEFRTHFGVFKKQFNPHVKSQFNEKTQRWEKTPGGANVPVVVGYRNLNQLNEMLQTISSRVTKDQVLDLPPKLYAKRYVQMSPEQSKLYAQMRDEFIVWVNTGGAEAEAAAAGLVPTAPAGLCPCCAGAREIVSDGFIYPCEACADQEVMAGEEGNTPIIAELIMVRLLRLQQIACGYIPTGLEEEPMYLIPGVNQRVKALCDDIETRPHKTIVWARFRMDITQIIEELGRRGIRAVRYDGMVDDDQRAEAKALFNGERAVYERGVMVGRQPIPIEDQAMVFVGNPAAGATGLTLTIAKNTDYFSNSFKLIDRLQSEDRNHRIGQENQVLYTDWIAENTVDERIVESLRNKFSIASQITGDRLKEWL